MERTLEDAALGLAGICGETLRVIRTRPPGFPFLFGVVITLSLSLLVHAAASRALFFDAVASDTTGAGFVRLAANWAPFILAEAGILSSLVLQSLVSVALCVLSVAAVYSGFAADAERDARAVARDLRQVPRFLSRFLVSVFRGDSRLAARLIRTGLSVAARVAVTSCVAFPLLLGYTAILAALAALTRTQLPRPALLVVGGTAYLAGAAHIGAVWRVACVLSVMEDGARGFRAIHGSDELLAGAGKFWAAAAVFMALDGCAVAAQLAFGALVVDDGMGIGVWVRVALGVAMAAVLWAALMAGLVAQVVVYLVCKRCCQRPDGTAEKSLADVGRRGRVTATRSRTRR